MRSGTRRYPPKFQTLKNAEVGKQVNIASGRIAMHYRCGICQGAFPAKSVEVDHINPVVDPNEGFSSWDTYIERLFCPIDNLMCVCKACHRKKSKAEKDQRKKATK